MKRSDFQKAIGNSTAIPVFYYKDFRCGLKVISVASTDSSVTESMRATFRNSNNVVLVRAIKFTKNSTDGKDQVEFNSDRAFLTPLNQIDLFAADYSEALERIEYNRARSEKAKESRLTMQALADVLRAKDIAICDELLPTIKESFMRFVNCSITKDWHNGDIAIHIPAGQLENLMELLSHTNAEA